ncbi:hypothetical protein ACNUDN_30530 [Mycobacterium sp. smrl_JER01]|uniref:hypothetical protein n=1 Tax=Mycobacterium sp. smrl_JER01 TaxID=3402633 RepID=UPI003AD48410
MSSGSGVAVDDDGAAVESDFIIEYEWLRSFGKTDAAIAHALGLSHAGFVKRLQRAGVRRAELSADSEIDARLRSLIASGAPFDSWSFPFACDPGQVSAALSSAVRRGLVVRVGGRLGGSCRAGRFMGVHAAPTEVTWDVA